MVEHDGDAYTAERARLLRASEQDCALSATA
jgi:hypothetical protein